VAPDSKPAPVSNNQLPFDNDDNELSLPGQQKSKIDHTPGKTIVALSP